MFFLDFSLVVNSWCFCITIFVQPIEFISYEHTKFTYCVLVEFCKSMAPGGRVFRQTTLTGETIQDTQSLDELNNPTPLVNTGNTFYYVD